MSIVSHDTEQMRNWSGTMENNANDYDSLINRLYTLIDGFVGSEQFRGGLSGDFLEKVLSKRTTFMQYSDTFRECSELITQTAGRIDSDEEALRARIGRANPLD